MSLLFNDNGLCFKFEDGNIKQIVLSYGKLNIDDFNKVISKISKL